MSTASVYDNAVTGFAGVEKIIRHGSQHNFNRQLHPDVMDRLDPDGYNVFMIVLFDHDRSGRPDIADDPMHHRCLGYLKLTDESDPLKVYVDISDEDYRSMEHVAPKASA